MMATAVSAAQLTNTTNGQMENVESGFYSITFLTILLAVAVIALLYYIWKKEQTYCRGGRGKENRNESWIVQFIKNMIVVDDEEFEEGETEDIVFEEKQPEPSCSQKPCLCFNECLFQESPYSDSGMTRQAPEIEVAGHSLQYQRLEQRDLYTIGRSNSSDIQILYNMSVSRQHARLECMAGQGFKLSLATKDNVIYRCNSSFEVIESITEYTFKEGTGYFILGDPQCGFRIAIRSCRSMISGKIQKTADFEDEISTRQFAGERKRRAV
ncbi:MAG: FHA domain-containing protein [Lachnospiraceae bacterium]|nr:FHA domain-containing protein [Lachnospiraceae bacterium]